MAFAGINYLAVLIAAVVSWLAGAVWYMALAKPWMAATGMTKDQMQECRKGPGAFLPFVYAFLASAVIAWVLLAWQGAGSDMDMAMASPTMGMRAPLFLMIWVVMMVAMMVPIHRATLCCHVSGPARVRRSLRKFSRRFQDGPGALSRRDRGDLPICTGRRRYR